MDKTRPNLKVLLIEDNPGDARLIQEMLTDVEPGAPFTPAFDLERAERLSTGLKCLSGDGVDVVLLDLSLPDSQALDTFYRTRTHAPNVPIVLLTGLDDVSFALEAVREGAQDYLVKGKADSHLLARSLCYAIERQRAEHALRQRNRELALLNRLSRELTVTLDLKELSERLLEAVTEIVKVDGSSVWFWKNGTGGALVCQAAFPGNRNRILANLRLRPAQGIVNWVALEEESALVNNAQNDPRFFPGIDEQTGYDTVSVLAVPLLARDKAIGVLELVNKREGDFVETDRVLVETMAASAAIAIDNACLVEALHRNAVELKARNQELDAFARTAAHNLKSPLAKIIGFCEVLEDYGTEPEVEVSGFLRLIARNGRKMSNIVDELLLLASVRQKEEVQLEPLNMACIVADALDRLAHSIEELEVELILPDTWPVALGYGPWVEEVWANYLSNAVKYGGRPPRVELGASIQADDTGRFWIRDNGAGLTPEEQARLFAPFELLDRVQAEGHGLGLSIVRHIVERLCGQVAVESQVGVGSQFSFSLPLAKR